MKTLTCTDSAHMISREWNFIRRFQCYIETSDWDEQIIRKEPVLNKICLVAVILSGLGMSPFLIAVLLK